MKPSEKQKKRLHVKIFTWWKKNRRDLPWRNTINPYEILVSELMLQQTQVSRVIPKYHAFLQKFPSTNDLAKASLGQILIEWKGLGYNRRAKYLHETAKEIEKTWNGKFPDKEELLRSLPGIGIYTARALLVFAFRKDVGVVDTNIRKIIQKELNAQNCSDKEIQQIADDMVPKGKSWEWHQALMDYGAATYTQKGTKKKNDIPFKESKRFIRGKILDRLREKNEKEETTIQIIKDVFQRKESETKEIIKDLIKEGLIEKNNGYLRLPL